jgi:hypothetical protein
MGKKKLKKKKKVKKSLKKSKLDGFTKYQMEKANYEATGGGGSFTPIIENY